MTDLPYKNNSFDMVVSNLAIDHVKNLNKAFKEMIRVCKKKGHIIVSTIHPDGKKGLRDAEFQANDVLVLMPKYDRPVSEYMELLNRNGALIKKTRNIMVSGIFKKKNPQAYNSLKAKNFILLIKAQKI